MPRLLVRDENGLWQAERWQTATPLPPDPGDLTHGADLEDDGSNSGYKALGLTLGDPEERSISTTSDNQVIEGFNIIGQINVNHDGVRIQGGLLTAVGTSHGIKVNTRQGTSRGVCGLTIREVEIAGPPGGSPSNGIRGPFAVEDGLPPNILQRLDVHHFANVATMTSGWKAIEVFGHNETIFGEAHNDCFQIQKAVPRTDGEPSFEVIRCKGIMGAVDGSFYAGTAMLWVNTINGDVGDNRVIDSLMQCGDVSVGIKYSGDHPKATGAFVGVSTVEGNRFVVGWPPQAPGPEFAMSFSAAGTVNHTGNRLVDTDGNDLGSAD